MPSPGWSCVAGTLEQIEHACLIALRDAAAVVGDLDFDTVVGNRAGPYLDAQRSILCAILDGVVEQVAEISSIEKRSLWIWLHPDRCRSCRRLRKVDAGSPRRARDRFLQIDRLGFQRPPSFTRELQNGTDQLLHLLGRGANVSDRFGQQFGIGGTRFLQDWSSAPLPARNGRRAGAGSPGSPGVRR